MSKPKVDIVFVNVPEQMFDIPETWDERIGYQIGVIAPQKQTLFIDWCAGRGRIDAITAEIGKYDYENAILWCRSYEAFARAVELQRRLKNSVIMGIPKRDDIPWMPWIGEGAVGSKPRLQWDRFIEPKLYYEGGKKHQHNLEVAFWEGEAPLYFRFPKKALKPEYVANQMHHLRAVYRWEAGVWMDDLTEDSNWTKSVLRELEVLEFKFPFYCRCDPEKVDKGFVIRLRESGCKIMDFGEIPISSLSLESRNIRLQGAIDACKESGVAPDLTWILDWKMDWENFSDAVDWARVWGLMKAKVHIPYDVMSLEDIMAIHGKGFYNPNPEEFSDLEIMGMLKALSVGQTDLRR